MSGDVPSEYGSMSEVGNQRALDNVADWLRNQVGSDVTSGVGSVCSSAAYMERFDENPTKSSTFSENREVLIPSKRVVTNSSETARRFSC